MTNQERWIEFCQQHTREVNLFDQPFWLDTVCNGRDNWDVFLVEEKDVIQAALPYYIKKKMGLRYITMPHLTFCSGIWLRPIENEKTEKRISREYKLYKLLIEQIEASGVAFYNQCFPPGVTNWQPFYWRDFRQKTLYTFRIDCKCGLERVQQEYSKSTRTNLRKAMKAGSVCELDDVALFYKINSMSFARRNAKNPVSLDLIERVYKVCKEHNAVKMLCAKDANGEICDVAFFVFDAMTVYALMSGSVPDKRGLNLHTMLAHEGIRFACETGRIFDFEGSMMPGVASNILRFGAEMYPYLSIKKVFSKVPVLKQYLKYRLYS